MRWLVLAVVALSGCVTPYQQMGYRGGYEDSEVAPGVYEIVVRGNAMTSLDTLRGYFHTRAKEVCAEQGKAYYDFDLSSNVVRDSPSYTARRRGDGSVQVQEDLRFNKGVVTGYVTCLDEPPPRRRQAR